MAAKMKSTSTPEYRSPPPPEAPRSVAARDDGWPAGEPLEVVDAGGLLWDRTVFYEPHRYALAVPTTCSPLLGEFFRSLWPAVSSDARVDLVYAKGGGYGEVPDCRRQLTPENRDERAQITAAAAKTAGTDHGPALERRRAWRVMDWRIHVEGPALLDLAGFKAQAAAFRALPPIKGPVTPAVDRVFRSAYRVTDAASSAALRGRKPYVRAQVRRRMSMPGWPPIHELDGAACDAVPAVAARAQDDERSPLGRGLAAAVAFPWMCIEHDKRVSDAEIARVAAEVSEAFDGLVREIVAMQPGRRS